MENGTYGSGTGSKRGFAALHPDQRRAVAQKGGQTAHALGRAYEYTPEAATVAGRKGGKAVSQNRAHMAALGRKGGAETARRFRQRRAAAAPSNTGATGGMGEGIQATE